MSVEYIRTTSQSKRDIQSKSGFSPFKRLPPIGNSNEYIPHPPQTPHLKLNPRIKQNQKQESILIAIRLNDGRRLEKTFNKYDKILDIMKYVKSQQNDLDEQFYLSSGDVPKRQFKDFNLTLSQANLETRTMEINEESSVIFYRKLLNSAKVFLTEIDQISSTSKSESTSRCQSASPSHSQSSISIDSKDIDQQLISTRQRCHQRLLACSRKKLRLLALQEQNDKRHLGFKKFVDNLDEKRCANIRRYQLELRDYLLKRLETDRLKQEVDLLNIKIDQLKEEKKRYSNLIDIVQRAIPLFPPGLLQSGSDGVKSLISRYQTLVETKSSYEQRDFSKEKQERRHELQRLILEHNTKIAKLSTRIAQLHDKLNDLQKHESINEEKLINKTDSKRSTATVISQLEASINYLFDRYRLIHQIKTTSTDQTIAEKLRTIQDFILYRIDLVQRAKS